MATDYGSAGSRLIYVIDDDEAIREVLARFFQESGFRVLQSGSGAAVLPALQQEAPDLILMDLRLPDQSGMQVLEDLHNKAPEIPVVMMTAYGSSSAAIQAIQRGAYDYITKPFDLDDMLHTVHRALEHRALARRVQEMNQPARHDGARDPFIGSTPAMQDIFKMIGRIAASDATIMIYGESGTGKELAAHAIHYNSLRRAAPFVKVSCVSFVETLLESELFGHEKGAFTHAVTQRKGRFEMANKGTIFLDEIGELSPNMQKKLLRVLQEREFERVGSSLTIKVDVRIIAATNRDLQKEVAEGRFREDLYYRLNVIALTMPPLRDRTDDIPLLVEHFLHKYRFGPDDKVARISGEALETLMTYSWPGNVRELENTIQRAVVLSQGDVITPEHVSFVPVTGLTQIDVIQRIASGVLLQALVEEVERSAILEALRQHDHSFDVVAERLGIDRQALDAKLHAYNLNGVAADSAAKIRPPERETVPG